MNQKPLLILQNSTEGPGLIFEILYRKNISTEVFNLHGGNPLPNPKKFSAIIVLGGPQSANDDKPTMIAELQWIKKILANGIPYFGVCLGLQTLVKAAGGTVKKNQVKETGIRDPQENIFEIELTDAGKRDRICKGLEPRSKVFQLHGETVELEEGMELLATGKYCVNQLVRVTPKAYGMQCHLELTEKMLHAWHTRDSDLSAVDIAMLQRDFEEVRNEFEETLDILLENFLAIAEAKHG